MAVPIYKIRLQQPKEKSIPKVVDNPLPLADTLGISPERIKATPQGERIKLLRSMYNAT